MFSEKIHSIYISITFLLLFCNLPSSFSTFRLQNMEIREYYLGSSEVYNLENNSKVRKREIGKNVLIFSLKLANDDKEFQVLIKRRGSDVVINNTRIVHVLGGNESIEEHLTNDSFLYEGYIFENPHNSSVNGYIKNSCFYGHVMVNNTMYYIDELNSLKNDFSNNSSEDIPQQQNAIIYTGNSVIFTGIKDNFPLNRMLSNLTQGDFERLFQVWKRRGMLCTLVVVIDHSFLTMIHRGNIEAATYQILFSLEEVNAIFRSTDFDGDGIPDNIGFYVKKIVILSSDEHLYFTTKHTKGALDVNDFIQKFRKYHELQNHCLGIIFTAQKFLLRTLGASFSADHEQFDVVGGICDSLIPGRGSFNALVITVVTEVYNPVPQLIFEVTIAHELGHSFGSTHDQKTDQKCYGYLMAPKTFSDYDKVETRMLFSDCSRGTILRTLVMKGKCFEQVKTSFCGNGLVEDDEQCDCGLTRDCLQKDPCCVPRRTKEPPCRVNKKMGYECHPSQGECCTELCKYSTNLQDYLNCNQLDSSCPCLKPDTRCRCGINGMCIQNECHSVECTRLGLNECQCQEIKLPGTCSICCHYKNECLPALEVTYRVIQETKEDKIMNELSSNRESSKFLGKNSISKKFCRRKAKSNNCVDLHFYQSRRDEFCLLKGKLGQCNRTFDCKLVPHKHVFPALSTKSGVTYFKLDFLNVVFYFLYLGLKI